ncbi:MAG TPA: TonB-dependent receptor [Kofleriaceae bacterium]|nr:TonB-dependent receptor [Kofleriaceae bacterium]
MKSDTSGVSAVSMYGAVATEEETVVGAAKREQSLGTVASAVTVITSDTLRRFGYRNLSEALRSVAGVYIVDDRQIARIGVRGVQLLGDANTRILILIDGTPLNEPWSQFVDGSTAIPVSMDDVARIEVIRGPVSSIYGTNAFLGIINIVTVEADKGARAYGRTTIDTLGTVGANAAFNQGDINRQVRGSVSYSYRTGERLSYEDLMGTTSADGAHALFGSIALNYDRLFAQVRAYDRMRELPGAPYNSSYGSSKNTNNDRHILAEVGYTRSVTDKVTLAVRAYANRYQYDGHLVFDSKPEFSTEATSLWYGGEVRALIDLVKRDNRNLLSLTTGANVELTQTRSTASTAMTPIEKDFDITGVYLEATSEPKKWFALTAGGRFDRNSLFQNKASPRAALFLHSGDDYGVKVLYAQGFRNPSIFEAYYDDGLRFTPALDGSGVSSLKPETITSYEVVAYGRPYTGVKLRVSAWQWDMNSLLQRQQVFIGPPVNDLRLRYQNSGSLISRGVEVESSYRDVAGRYAYANAALSYTGRNCLGDTGLGNFTLDPSISKGNCDFRQNAPVFVGKAGLSSQILFDLFYASGELSYVSSRGTQDMSTTVPAYVGLDAIFYAPDVHGMDVTVGARNLLGAENVPAQSDYNRGSGATEIQVLEVPGPGRMIFARVGYRF